MDRRTLVKYLGTVSAAGALAGCINAEQTDSGNGNGNGDENGTGSDDGDDGDGNENGNGNESETDSEWETLEPEDGVTGSATLWHDRESAEQELLAEVVDEFNEQYEPTISLNQVADIDDRTRTAIPAGEGPEGFEWAHDWAGTYWEEGLLSDQSGNLRVEMETFTGDAPNAVEWEGNVVGLPHAAETTSLIYNAELVDEPPETFEELEAIMDEHHDPDNGMYGFTFPIDPYFYSGYAHAYGGFYYDEEADELGLSNEETVRGLEFVIDELYPYMPRDYGYEAQANTFQSGNAPFTINGPWAVGNLDFEYGIAGQPSPPDGEPEPYTGISNIYFASAMDDDEERAAAFRSFAEWFVTNVDVQRRQADELGYIPVHAALADSDETGDDVSGFMTDIERGRAMPQGPKMDAVWTPLEEEFEEAINENKSVPEAMEDAEERIRDNWD